MYFIGSQSSVNSTQINSSVGLHPQTCSRFYPSVYVGREGGDRKDGKMIHENNNKVSRAKCKQLFELIGSHEHCVYLAAYPHHSVHVYIHEAGLSLYSVTYLPTIERMTEVERGQEGPLQVLYFKREARVHEGSSNCSDSSDPHVYV